MKLTCIFSTGRTGTGYLSQLFGGEYSKKAVHINKDSMVTHESWPELKYQVMKIKESGRTSAAKVEIQDFFYQRFETLKKEHNKESYFITDHRIGRYFLWALLDSKIDIQVIKINKDPDLISKSFINRFKLTKERVPEKYASFYNDVWTKSFYHPNDKYTITQPKAAWSDLDDNKRLLWYCEETEARWDSLKKSLDKSKYIEIEFKQLFDFTSIENLSSFIDIEFSKERFNKVANR